MFLFGFGVIVWGFFGFCFVFCLEGGIGFLYLKGWGDFVFLVCGEIEKKINK